jgi:TonB family protein
MKPNLKPMDYLNRNRKYFFEIGLIIALISSLTALEWKSKKVNSNRDRQKLENNLHDDDVIITIRQKPQLKAEVRSNPDKIAISDAPDKIEITLLPEKFEDGEADSIYDIDIDDAWDLPETVSYTMVQQKPTFASCETEKDEYLKTKCFERMLVNHVARNYKHTREAQLLNITGRVYVTFIIDIDGSITEVEELKSEDDLLNQAAVDAVKSLNHMAEKITPAQNRNKPVRVKYMIPVNTKRF